MLQNTMPSNVQLVQVWPGGGAEVSQLEICKIHLAVIATPFSPCRTWQGSGCTHILAPEGSRLSTSEIEWYYRIFCTPQSPISSHAWKREGASSFLILGVMTPGPWSGLYAVCRRCDIFYWLSKVFVNLLIDKFSLVCVVPHRRKFSHLQNTSLFGH